ncbi:MAG: YafY family transcriptional regulator [Paracoccaceae bacterium]|nr:YafY family transcriptional regulator [Paracoccaceae bacterium]
MRRADRLFQIVQYLRGGRLTTARALADRLEVSERTIYRDVADLIGSGVPIEGEAGVGYLMRAGYDLPPLMLTREEVVALVAGARLLRAWGGQEMARAAEEALVKIEAVLPEAERARAGAVQIHAFSMLDLDPATRQRLDLVERAIEERARLRLAYEDEAGQRTARAVRPLALVFWGKVWTLVAWCELREDFRVFRVDRMAEAETEGRFRPEKGRTLRDFYAREVPPEAWS